MKFNKIEQEQKRHKAEYNWNNRLRQANKISNPILETDVVTIDGLGDIKTYLSPKIMMDNSFIGYSVAESDGDTIIIYDGFGEALEDDEKIFSIVSAVKYAELMAEGMDSNTAYLESDKETIKYLGMNAYNIFDSIIKKLPSTVKMDQLFVRKRYNNLEKACSEYVQPEE